jgi:CrcB protein
MSAEAAGSHRSAPRTTPLGIGVLVTAVGGAAGAVLRWMLTVSFPAGAGEFPRTTFAINVLGSALLAALVLAPGVRARPWLSLLLGTGVLGGFTTMSAASAETFTLLDRGEVGLGIGYAVGTLLFAVASVWLVDRFASDEARIEFEQIEGDE